MHISYYQTVLVIAFLVVAIILTAKSDYNSHGLSPAHTNELKGVAILMVLFSHIGYFLFSDHTFLYPLSVAGGVGVNIFLFLSGYGLTRSEAKVHLGIMPFYAKRLGKIFLPMWFVLVATLLLDKYLIGLTYPSSTIIPNLLGFFPNSDLYTAVNSPLWYFSLILFYYLLFPVIYKKRYAGLSVVLVAVLGYLATRLPLPVTKDVLKLYQLHYLAFPLGMLFAHVRVCREGGCHIPALVSYPLVVLLCAGFAYTAINSGIGEEVWLEQLISLVSTCLVVLIFIVKSFRIGFLSFLGRYSYEIYLIQWPLMYRHDFIYKYTPPFLGTLIYLGVLVLIGFSINKIMKLAKV